MQHQRAGCEAWLENGDHRARHGFRAIEQDEVDGPRKCLQSATSVAGVLEQVVLETDRFDLGTNRVEPMDVQLGADHDAAASARGGVDRTHELHRVPDLPGTDLDDPPRATGEAREGDGRGVRGEDLHGQDRGLVSMARAAATGNKTMRPSQHFVAIDLAVLKTRFFLQHISQHLVALSATKWHYCAMTSSPSRGASVVDAVLGAALGELARVGYAGLSVEDVARSAGVNRTTVYRRWPTKLELVSAALLGAIPDGTFDAPDSGSIQGDLTLLAVRIARFAQTVAGRATVRVFFFESQLPELEELGRQMQSRSEAEGIPRLLHRAIARGELPVGFDVRLLHDTLAFTMLCSGLVESTPPDITRVAKLVEVLLRGLRPTSA